MEEGLVRMDACVAGECGVPTKLPREVLAADQQFLVGFDGLSAHTRVMQNRPAHKAESASRR